MIENEQGYDEGDDSNGLPLSTFSNQGSIKKTGSGASRIAADYSASGGSSTEVEDGSLLLPDGTKADAVVAAGSSYGTGICDLVSEECGPDTSDQVAWLTIPSSEDGGATVGVELKPDVEDDDALGSVIDVETDHLNVNKAAPAVLQLRYDSTLLEKQDGSFRTWRDLEVIHEPDGGRDHQLVPCTKTGDIPSRKVACVDRRDKPGSSRQVGDDVIMVVLTTETSRWRVP